ncbi:OTU domain-containing protein [Plasmodiophora brassicae]|uniref:OTU domain-containing protein n=1 Tax=Plasmodiophora brassicae TaxID=37360 RepID=A0A0G4J8X0_PLABS|nr:hypothetical protein PBRA_003328 [Plasmodiophora brassicae]
MGPNNKQCSGAGYAQQKQADRQQKPPNRQEKQRKKQERQRRRYMTLPTTARDQQQAASHEREESAAEDLSAEQRELDLKAIQRQVAMLRLRIKDVAGDGSCLFSAIADQLNIIPDHKPPVTVRKTRHDITSYIEVHGEAFAGFIGKETLEEYCTRMRKMGEWGGQPELLAAMQHYQISIVVHQLKDPKALILKSPAPGAKTIHLSYHEGRHYGSCRPSQGIREMMLAGKVHEVMDRTSCPDVDRIRFVLDFCGGIVDAACESILAEQDVVGSGGSGGEPALTLTADGDLCPSDPAPGPACEPDMPGNDEQGPPADRASSSDDTRMWKRLDVETRGGKHGADPVIEPRVAVEESHAGAAPDSSRHPLDTNPVALGTPAACAVLHDDESAALVGRIPDPSTDPSTARDQICSEGPDLRKVPETPTVQGDAGDVAAGMHGSSSVSTPVFDMGIPWNQGGVRDEEAHRPRCHSLTGGDWPTPAESMTILTSEADAGQIVALTSRSQSVENIDSTTVEPFQLRLSRSEKRRLKKKQRREARAKAAEANGTKQTWAKVVHDSDADDGDYEEVTIDDVLAAGISHVFL